MAQFGACADAAARKYIAGKKLVIGYLVSAFVDPEDAVAVAAVARAHDRAQVTVLGFGLGSQTADQKFHFDRRVRQMARHRRARSRDLGADSVG